MSFSIDGKVAIVTGAANGIGLAVARHFVSSGAKVMFADMDEDSLVKELGPEPDENMQQYFAGDLRERLTLANLLSATLDAFDKVDILVNASRQVLASDFLNPEDMSVETCLEQNVLASFHLSQLVAQRMIKQSDADGDDQVGAIVNLSSISARRATPSLMGYSIASAAMDQMTRTMAVTLAPHRIRVNAVSVGSVMSASLQRALREHGDFRGDIEEHTPMGRIAPAIAVVETVQYLASESAGFMTGQVLTVDGGRTLIDPVSAPVH